MPQLTPQNQLDALPLLSVESVGAPGDVNVIGGVLTRYYDATAVGFPAEFVNQGAGGSALISNPLDLRGCVQLVLVLTLEVTGAPGDAGRTYQPYVLFQNAAALGEDINVGVSSRHRTAGDLSIPAGIGSPSTTVWSVTIHAAALQATGGGGGIAIGADGVRLVLRDGLNNPGSQIWSGEVYASS